MKHSVEIRISNGGSSRSRRVSGEHIPKKGPPVKTGKLRRSYATRLESKSSDEVVMRTGTDVDYAPDQEFGTSKQSGTPHLRPGFQNHKRDSERCQNQTEYMISTRSQ